jgi:hypothetical protein
MQGQNASDSKVVSIFESRNKSKSDEETPQSETAAQAENPLSFQEVMKQNQKNKERMEKERLSANKSVLRSYRIKH